MSDLTPSGSSPQFSGQNLPMIIAIGLIMIIAIVGAIALAGGFSKDTAKKPAPQTQKS